MSEFLVEGSKAPDFSAMSTSGQMVSLQDFVGKQVVLYFYPKDDTPGCTTEACSFRDARDALAEFGNATVIGISKDSTKSHKKFVEKHDLNFTLLSDPSHETIEAFGAWGKKKFMGREYEGIKRNTYIVNPKGDIAQEYENVTPKTHVGLLLKDLKNLQQSTNE